MPVWAYLLAVPIFGFLILVHEAGHYLAARLSGIGVAEFSVGIGPRLFGFSRRGTVWSVRLIPLGGYVRWEEEGLRAFHNRPLLARAAALFGGPGANLLLTGLLVALLLGLVRGHGWAALLSAPRITTMMAGAWIQSLVGLLGGAQGLSELSGPVGIAQVTAEVVMAGADQILLFSAFLSLNVALFNLIPFPALDGGRLLLLAMEAVRRRPLDPYVEGWIHACGFLLLMGLLILTTVKDFLT